MRLLCRRSVLAVLSGSAFFSLPMMRPLAQTNSTYKERKVALIVSNAAYQNHPLAGPPRDASLIAKKLNELNFDTVTVVSDADQMKMNSAIYAFWTAARLADTAIFYYAGHALELDGANLLLPINASIDDDAAARIFTVPAIFALDAVSNAKKFGFLVLDACRNNPFLGQMKLQGGSSRQFDHGLAPMVPRAKNILIQYSAGSGDLAEDGTGSKGSPFARAMVAGLSEPGLSVQQVIQRVTHDVEQATEERQRPYFSGSVSEDIFIVPSKKLHAESPLIIDFQFADPKDPATSTVVFGDIPFDFKYTLLDKVAGDNTRSLVPEHPYFSAREQGHRPLIVVEKLGWYAPKVDGIGSWYLSYPIVDVMARRTSEETVSLSELIVEVDKSEKDNEPYVNVLSTDQEFCELWLINEGWSAVQSATFEYDLYLKKPTSEEIHKVTAEKSAGGYKFSTSVANFIENTKISLETGIQEILPEFSFYKYAFAHPPADFHTGKHKEPSSKEPAGYRGWLTKHPSAFQNSIDENSDTAIWALGRLVVIPEQAGLDVVVTNVFAPVTIFPPYENGAGGAIVDVYSHIPIRSSGEKYLVRKNLGYVLDKDSRTFRGLYPLVVDQTSNHRFRIRIQGNGGQELFASEWIKAKIVVPKTAAKYQLRKSSPNSAPKKS